MEVLARPGGDSSAGAALQPGLLIGFGGGRRKEGFVTGVRPFLRDFGVSIPRVGCSAELLAEEGKKLHELLRKTVELLLRNFQSKGRIVAIGEHATTVYIVLCS